MRKIIIVLALSLSIGGCATLETIQKVQEVANATVPASVVIPAANAFNIVKAGATRYGQYCIKEKMAPVICEAGTRRAVIKAVRAGTNARNRMTDSLINGTPASASIYNLMVGAIDDLKNSPANSVQFVGAPQ
jgi:uncharacterized protein YceK